MSPCARRLRFTPSRMVRTHRHPSEYIRVCLWVLFAVIVENGVKLRLNIVDTPGYGDQINNENWYVHPSMPCPFCPTHTSPTHGHPADASL